MHRTAPTLPRYQVGLANPSLPAVATRNPLIFSSAGSLLVVHYSSLTYLVYDSLLITNCWG